MLAFFFCCFLFTFFLIILTKARHAFRLFAEENPVYEGELYMDKADIRDVLSALGYHPTRLDIGLLFSRFFTFHVFFSRFF